MRQREKNPDLIMYCHPQLFVQRVLLTQEVDCTRREPSKSFISDTSCAYLADLGLSSLRGNDSRWRVGWEQGKNREGKKQRS